MNSKEKVFWETPYYRKLFWRFCHELALPWWLVQIKLEHAPVGARLGNVAHSVLNLAIPWLTHEIAPHDPPRGFKYDDVAVFYVRELVRIIDATNGPKVPAEEPPESRSKRKRGG